MHGNTLAVRAHGHLQLGGRAALSPMATTRTTCLSGRFLSEDERVLIADRIRAGASLRAIGRYLGRPA